MTKYLILLIFPALVFSPGCDDDMGEIKITNSIIDEKFIGIWGKVESIVDYDYYRSYSSTGKWNSWEIDTIYNITYSLSGDYWVQDNYLLLNDPVNNLEYVFSYSFTNDTLTLGQDGEFLEIWVKKI